MCVWVEVQACAFGCSGLDCSGPCATQLTLVRPSPASLPSPPTSPPPRPLQDGINAQWQAFYFSNAKYPLKSIKLNGTPLQRNEFQVRGGQRGLPTGQAWGA